MDGAECWRAGDGGELVCCQGIKVIVLLIMHRRGLSVGAWSFAGHAEAVEECFIVVFAPVTVFYKVWRHSRFKPRHGELRRVSACLGLAIQTASAALCLYISNPMKTRVLKGG